MLEELLESIEGLSGLREIYKRLDEEIAVFTARSGLRCPELCGACCRTPSRNIEVTVLEMMLPALAIWEGGFAAAVLERLGATPEDIPCVLFEPGSTQASGRCGAYGSRGLVCRLFGFAGYIDKHGAARFSRCATMKRVRVGSDAATDTEIERIPGMPILAALRHAVAGLNPPLAERLYPINIALKIAIERIGFSLYYRNGLLAPLSTDGSVGS